MQADEPYGFYDPPPTLRNHRVRKSLPIPSRVRLRMGYRAEQHSNRTTQAALLLWTTLAGKHEFLVSLHAEGACSAYRTTHAPLQTWNNLLPSRYFLSCVLP